MLVVVSFMASSRDELHSIQKCLGLILLSNDSSSVIEFFPSEEAERKKKQKQKPKQKTNERKKNESKMN